MAAIITTQGAARRAALDLARAASSALRCVAANPAEGHRLVVAQAIEQLADGQCTVVCR